MSQPVELVCHEEIGVITLDHPPVNALSQAVRAGLIDAIARAEQDSRIRVVIIIGAGRAFSAGADIREFGQPPQPPSLPELVARIESSSKPVIAAIHGNALGGGLEVALGCHFRVAAADAKLGLPEVKLGMIPGAGGTQRLPRLIGARAAIDLIVSGNPIDTRRALEIGVIDEIVEGDVRVGAMDFARRVVSENRPVRRTSALKIHTLETSEIEQLRADVAKRHRGLIAPQKCIDAVVAATERPFAEGMAFERRLFLELRESSQAKALRHAFFVEREASRPPGFVADAPTRDIATVAVVGAGTMGTGIAICFADAGIPVKLLESNEANLQRGLEKIRQHYDGAVKRGRVDRKTADQRLSLIQPTLMYEDLATADLVIEAAFEDIAVKEEVFRRLDAIVRDGAILASNTSYLDLNRIASFTRRPQDVVGMHFFSPANVMRLLEVVRGEQTAQDVLATAIKVGRSIGKTPVLCGACDGFIGNRMLARRTREAYFLLEEGATPWQVDRVFQAFGFPMGPFAVGDLSGLDIGWRNRQARLHTLTPRERACTILDELCEQGRLGQKTGAGFYRYDEQRTPKPDPDVEALIERHSRKVGITRRAIPDQEILERCLYAMINEGARILEEGIAARPLDIDAVWLFGYGFPRHRGGPMFYADEVGLTVIHDAILRYGEKHGTEFWTPAPLLVRLAREHRGFYESSTR